MDIFKKTEEEFDKKFLIGVSYNNDKRWQYAMMRDENENCADVSNKDIKKFIRQAQISAINEVLEEVDKLVVEAVKETEIEHKSPNIYI